MERVKCAETHGVIPTQNTRRIGGQILASFNPTGTTITLSKWHLSNKVCEHFDTLKESVPESGSIELSATRKNWGSFLEVRSSVNLLFVLFLGSYDAEEVGPRRGPGGQYSTWVNPSATLRCWKTK